MDMKNTAILLMFLLCILGLIIGVHYTETSDSAQDSDEYEEVISQDPNETITIEVELNETALDEFFT